MCLPSTDLELKKECKGRENATKLVDSRAFVPEIQKSIEQVGNAYEKLKRKMYRY